jgi:hypothetical protein
VLLLWSKVKSHHLILMSLWDSTSTFTTKSSLVLRLTVLLRTKIQQH